MTNYYPIEFQNNGTDFTVLNSGTAPAPCIVTIVPKVDIMSLVITGLSKSPITVNGVLANQTLVIDGENRTVTLNEEDYFDHYDAWEFPKLQPGVNEIRITSGAQTQVAIEYSQRFI